MSHKVTIQCSQAVIDIDGLLQAQVYQQSDIVMQTAPAIAAIPPVLVPCQFQLSRVLAEGDQFNYQAYLTQATNPAIHAQFNNYGTLVITSSPTSVNYLNAGVNTFTFQGVSFTADAGNQVLYVAPPADMPGSVAIISAYLNLIGQNQLYTGGALSAQPFPSWVTGPFWTATVSGSTITLTLGSSWDPATYWSGNEYVQLISQTISYGADGGAGYAEYDGDPTTVTNNAVNFTPVSHCTVTNSGYQLAHSPGPVTHILFGQHIMKPGSPSDAGAAAVPPQAAFWYVTGQLYDANVNAQSAPTDTSHATYSLKMFEASRHDDLVHTITAQGELGLGDKPRDDLANPPPIGQFRLDETYGIDTVTGTALPDPDGDNDPLIGGPFYGCRDRDPINFYPGEGRRYIAMAVHPTKCASGLMVLKMKGTFSKTVSVQGHNTPGYDLWPAMDETIGGHDAINGPSYYDNMLGFWASVQGHGTYTVSIPFTITTV